ncbi:MAG TPA: AbrB/MazE/SpoVT family DNA-binding domain-containing protein [Pyrinomonadaceae bacterium]|nr:AbrB/MazE/SpoVT family DNA-binding domain-containing protein [Pyrinomonadaceae bacterium]
MLTVIANSENSRTISIPADEMEKLGINDGDELEVTKNENNEIVLRPAQSERRRKVLEATREIIEERKSALIELGKGHE